MLGHGGKFSQRMEQAIAALLSHRSVEEAARAVGIGTNTLLRWMKKPEFKAACREARRMVLSHTIGRMQDAAGAAATTVLKIMLDSNAPAATRLRASENVLDQAAKAGEIEDIEDRVAKLELAAGLARRSRKPSADLTWLSAKPLPFPVTPPAQIAAPLDNADTDKDVVE
jgi:transposase-like protein